MEDKKFKKNLREILRQKAHNSAVFEVPLLSIILAVSFDIEGLYLATAKYEGKYIFQVHKLKHLINNLYELYTISPNPNNIVTDSSGETKEKERDALEKYLDDPKVITKKLTQK